MTDERILSGDEVIDRSTPDYKECLAALKSAEQTADRLITAVKPSILGERYFTSEEIMTAFHISRRALQNYRDNGTIPYTSIGGIILYPESKILEALNINSNKSLHYTF